MINKQYGYKLVDIPGILRAHVVDPVSQVWGQVDGWLCRDLIHDGIGDYG